MVGTKKDWDDLSVKGTVNYITPTPFEPVFDSVLKPEHYNTGIIEAIDYIENQLGKEKFTGYLEGNMLKYNHRWKYKNGVEDLKKAQWYLARLIETLEAEE